MLAPDEELLERVRQRDVEAFDALCERYRTPLRMHLVRMLRDPEAARDLTQETLLRLWTHADQWQGRGSCRGWLLRVATNLALNHVQSTGRRRARLGEVSLEGDDIALEPAAFLGGREALPQDAAEQAEGTRLLEGLIDGLPRPKREVVRLALLLDNDLEGVSASLALPRGTVKSRLHYARKLLAQRWKEVSSEWED